MLDTKPNLKARCLLVDDLNENLIALEAVLRRDDLEIFKARSGREALELLLVHDFALAILDVQMPEIDGFELATLMRTSERSRGTPIIFVTAAGRDTERHFQGYEAGAVDFLFKPLDPHILRHKVDVFLELYRQRAELSESLRLNEEFVAIVTHDLRAPLASIMMVADVVKKQSEDPQLARQMGRILRTSRQLLTTVNELLDLSRARLAGGIPIDPRVVDMESVVKRAVSDMKTAHPERTILLDVAPGNYIAQVDGSRIEQVITNLLANAIAHGLPETPVDVRLEPRDDGWLLVVTNSGEIPPALLRDVFAPFRSGRRASPANGLGLGLYIVEQIVRAHGGSVDVESDRGTTRFRVHLRREARAEVA